MSNLKCLTTIILFGLCVTPSVTKFGQICQKKADCVYGTVNIEDCRDGFCNCTSKSRLHFDEHSLAPDCNPTLYLKTRYCKSSSEKCPPNSKCLDKVGCRCDDEYVFVGTDCRKVLYQKVMEPCHIQNGSVYVCDYKEHSFCGEKKCVCFNAFLPNITSGRCEPEGDFLGASNLTKYIVLHGEYCNSKSHCIEGLECSKHACACPSTCIYKKEMQVCDCGASGPSTGPIVVGILGGLLIIAFWSWTIRNTWRRYTKMQEYQDEAAPPSVQRSTASYPLARLHSLYQLHHFCHRKKGALGLLQMKQTL